MSRKLATIRRVSDILPIEGADSIEVAIVDSWKVVVKKNEVTKDSLVVYFEIDSWIPHTIAPFLSKKAPKKYNEIEGEKLRTIRLKGQISQGLILNISYLVGIVPELANYQIEQEGTDITDVLGITKWELPSSMASFHTKGSFPSLIPKTDQERIQNLTKRFDQIKESRWEVTEKYDGSSMTIYAYKDSEGIINEGVCSRNLDLKKEIIEPSDDPNEDPKISINSYWEIAIRENLIEKIKRSGLNIAIQGELVGVKIGPNIYKLIKRDFYVFDIYNISEGRYFTPYERQEFCLNYDIKHVPILYNDFKISEEMTIDDILKIAEGESVLNGKTEREGIVFKNNNNKCGYFINSFKAISNNFLMKHTD